MGDPFCVPLTNTVVLISSGFTLTYANHALIVGCHEECLQAMTYTVALGGFFSYQQWWSTTAVVSLFVKAPSLLFFTWQLASTAPTCKSELLLSYTTCIVYLRENSIVAA